MARENSGRPLDYAKVMQIRRLSLCGLSLREIARMADVSTRTVQRYLATQSAERKNFSEKI